MHTCDCCKREVHSVDKLDLCFACEAVKAFATMIEDATDLDILLLRGRIAFGAAGWREVRDDFAAWLRRPEEKPRHAAPKRGR